MEKNTEASGINNFLQFWQEKICANLAKFFPDKNLLLIIDELDKKIQDIETKKSQINEEKANEKKKKMIKFYLDGKNKTSYNKTNKKRTNQTENIFYDMPLVTSTFANVITEENEKESPEKNRITENLDKDLFIPKIEEFNKNVFSITRYKKTYIRYIDIDLFLQRIALGHSILEDVVDDMNVLDGFCLQHSIFISIEILIKKIISCFKYFYTKFEKKEEEKEKEEEEDEEEDTYTMEDLKQLQKRKTCVKKKKSNVQLFNAAIVSCIPYGLIDFLFRYFNMLIKYNNEIPVTIVSEIFDFFNNLLEIKEVKEKYEKNIISYKNLLREITMKKEQSPKIPIKTKIPPEKIFPIIAENNENKQNTSYFKSFFDVHHYDSKDIAAEITRVSYYLISKIEPEEFYMGKFTKKDKEKTSPNICKMVKRFNDLSYFVIEEILSYDYSSLRGKAIEKYIDIADKLLELNNFNDCMSVVSALGTMIILKLAKAWKNVSSKSDNTLRNIKKVLNFEENYKNIREQIAFCEINDKPFLPFLGFYTKKICFIEEAGPYVKDGNSNLINVDKILQVYLVINEFNKFKNREYEFNMNENIKNQLSIFQCIEAYSEDELATMATFVEPHYVLTSKKTKEKRATLTEKKFVENYEKNVII